MGYASLTIDDNGERQGCEPIPQRSGKLERIVAANKRRVIQIELPRELDDLVRLVYGDADKLQTPGSELPLSLNELGHLFPAGLAPRCPEVDDEHLSSPLAQRLRRSLNVRKRECKQRGRIRRMTVPECHPDSKAQCDGSRRRRNEYLPKTGGYRFDSEHLLLRGCTRLSLLFS